MYKVNNRKEHIKSHYYQGNKPKENCEIIT